ncbi:MAG: tetratricopeptide repeat protein [Methanomassiliicoccales archaeon]|nr:MAG: tetratricopeptide repeat protein [Methanomassiliicoccales archaeon]
MATLKTQQFIFKPDMNIIREQCDQVIRREPSLAPKITAAMSSFDDVIEHINHGDVQKAIEKIYKSVGDVFDVGLDELEASCFFYIGSLALAIGDDEQGINLLNGALYKTQNPWLTLTVNNRLMIYHLSNDNYDNVMSLVNTTLKVVSKLPRSNASTYYSSAAKYSRAEAHFQRAEYSEVITHIESALTGFRDLSMKAEIAKCQGLLGNALIAKGDVKRGLPYTLKSLKQFRKLKNEDEIGFLLQGRALAMVQIGKKAEAIKDLRKALKLFKRRGDSKAINTTLAILSNLED